MTTTTTTTTKKANIEERVRKLLAQAHDQEGTPEGETFRAKAFEMIARYGIEEAALARNEKRDDIVQSIVELGGVHSDLRSYLMSMMADALHCMTVVHTVSRSRRISKIEIFGRKAHVERVVFLFDVLAPQMLALAAKAKREHHWEPATATQRRSVMLGFMQGVKDVLVEVERRTVEAVEQESGKDLCLVDDKTRAQEALATAHPVLGQPRKGPMIRDRNSFDEGREAGREAARRNGTAMSGRKALAG